MTVHSASEIPTGGDAAAARDRRNSADRGEQARPSCFALREQTRGLSWGERGGRLVVFGSVNDDTIGDFAAVLERAAASTPSVVVDLTGMEYISRSGIDVLVDWCRRHQSRSRLVAPAEIDRLLGFCVRIG